MTATTPRSISSGNSRNATFDLIRGLGILYIVGYWHLLCYTNAFPNYSRPPASVVTVVVLGLFVLISGFLAGGKDIKFGGTAMWAFYQSRLLRIYPPYLLAIALFKVLDISTTPILVKSVLLISMFSVPAPPTLWFVAMILCFYLVTPLLCCACRSLLLYTLACIFIVVSIYLYDQATGTVDLRIIIYLPAYAAGIFFARNKDLLRGINLILIAFLVALSVFICFHDLTVTEESVYSTPLVFFAPLLIIAISTRRVSIRRGGWVEVLSYSGYFMYLFHRPIFEVARRLYFPVSAGSQLAFLLGICLPVIVLVCWFAQFAYDRLVVYLVDKPPALDVARL